VVITFVLGLGFLLGVVMVETSSCRRFDRQQRYYGRGLLHDDRYARLPCVYRPYLPLCSLE
jgi:hypothetical protein